MRDNNGSNVPTPAEIRRLIYGHQGDAITDDHFDHVYHLTLALGLDSRNRPAMYEGLAFKGEAWQEAAAAKIIDNGRTPAFVDIDLRIPLITPSMDVHRMSATADVVFTQHAFQLFSGPSGRPSRRKPRS